jgi:hypothetical protein
MMETSKTSQLIVVKTPMTYLCGPWPAALCICALDSRNSQTLRFYERIGVDAGAKTWEIKIKTSTDTFSVSLLVVVVVIFIKLNASLGR